MKPTDKLIEEINEYLTEKIETVGVSREVAVHTMRAIKRLAESARAERDKEILEILPQGFMICQTDFEHGYDECLDEVKSLINNPEAK